MTFAGAPLAVLVTGAGLIGSLCARAIEREGGTAILFDIAPNEIAIRRLGFAGRIATGDITDFEGLVALVKRDAIGAVIHTAVAQSGALQAAPRLAVSVNIGGTLNVLETARACGLGRVVIAGSSTVTYASFDIIRRLGLPLVPEDVPSASVSARQTSLYAASKAACEQFAAIYADQYGADVVVLRYAAVLGHWGGSSALPTQAVLALVRPALRGEAAHAVDPSHAWAGIEEFVDARDCADAALAALRAPRPPQVVYNIAHPAPVTRADLVAAVRRRFPEMEVSDGIEVATGFAGYRAPRPAIADVSAAARDLGFHAARTLRDSVNWIVDVESGK